MPSRSALLLLADGRLPAGGHVHSWGVEEAVARERIHDVPTLRDYVRGRLHSAGLTDAALAAAAAQAAAEPRADWAALDAEVGARTIAPALRQASRAAGRALLRAGQAVWPHAALDALLRAVPGGPHQPLAFGVVGHAAGVGAGEIALAAAHLAVAAPCTAAIRLLGLDPFAVHALAARLAGEVDAVAAEAAEAAATAPWSALPCPSAAAAELGAEWHATWEVRLFAS